MKANGKGEAGGQPHRDAPQRGAGAARPRRLPEHASYNAWTSERTSLTDAFASPNSIDVFGS